MTPPTESRTARFAGGLLVAAASHVLILLVGLWLTRFILRTVGQAEYGLWLVALQVMAYLSLADLGVVAVLPRETAFASGRAAQDPAAVQRLAGETARLSLWQTPLVAVAALVLWAMLPEAWAPLRPVLAPVLLAFVLTFPLRGLQALLQGLQDLRFLGLMQLGVWAAGTAVVVTLLAAGVRLPALAAGWIAMQVLPPAVAWWRLRHRFPHALPSSLPPLDLAAARPHFARALWVSLGQVSALLVSGTDVLIIGLVLGPAAVVPYAMTGKLIAVAANLPSLVAHMAGPGLSELRVRESHERRLQVATALMLAVLLVSGLIAAVVLLVNEGFVTWWVGGRLYGGATLTALLTALLLVRHWGTTVVFAVYSFGHERRLALTGIGEGLVTVAATLVMVRWLGIIGAPIGALAGACMVTLPAVVPVLARETGISVPALLGRHLPWVWRLALVLAVVAAVPLAFRVEGLGAVVLASAAIAALYAALMAPLARRPPLESYVRQALDAVLPAAWRRAPAAADAS